jgi:hypothetical protein
MRGYVSNRVRCRHMEHSPFVRYPAKERRCVLPSKSGASQVARSSGESVHGPTVTVPSIRAPKSPNLKGAGTLCPVRTIVPTGTGATLCAAVRAAYNGPYGSAPHVNGPSDDFGRPRVPVVYYQCLVFYEGIRGDLRYCCLSHQQDRCLKNETSISIQRIKSRPRESCYKTSNFQK